MDLKRPRVGSASLGETLGIAVSVRVAGEARLGDNLFHYRAHVDLTTTPRRGRGEAAQSRRGGEGGVVS